MLEKPIFKRILVEHCKKIIVEFKENKFEFIDNIIGSQINYYYVSQHACNRWKQRPSNIAMAAEHCYVIGKILSQLRNEVVYGPNCFILHVRNRLNEHLIRSGQTVPRTSILSVGSILLENADLS